MTSVTKNQQPSPWLQSPQTHNLAQSALDFLLRIDAIDEVTHHHWVWYTHHPGNRYKTFEELLPEIESQKEPGSVIKTTSKSGYIRELAQSYEASRDASIKRGQLWPTGFSIDLLLHYLLSRWRILAQLFRVPFVLITFFIIYFTHIQFNNINTIEWLSTIAPTIPKCFIPYILLPAMMISLLSQLYTLFFDDKMFARAWLGWQSLAKEGLYVHPDDKQQQIITDDMPILKEPEKHPFGWFNGDIQTIIPGVYFDTLELNIPYIRRYIRNTGDNECCAVDIAFPRNEYGQLYFDKSKSIYVFHHGLNGSSNASYLQAHVDFYLKLGHTCMAINARGFGGGLVLRRPFTGARVSDLHALITVAHIGAGNNTIDDLIMHTRRKVHTLRCDEPQLLTLHSVFKEGRSPMNIVDNNDIVTTPVCLTGFSMGGIISANYGTYYGKYAGVHSIFSVCALGDRNKNQNDQSERDWELSLASTLKEFVSRAEPMLYHQQNGGDEYGDGVGRFIDLKALSRAKTIREFDTIFTCIVHGVPTTEHYYHDLSFAGSLKLENLRVPLFVMHAANDPVVDVDNMYQVTQILTAEDQQDNDFVNYRHQFYRDHSNIRNLTVFIPKNGGHVASFRTFNDKWGYLCELTHQFHTSVQKQITLAKKQGRNFWQFGVDQDQKNLLELNSNNSMNHKVTLHGYKPTYRQHSLHTLKILDQDFHLKQRMCSHNTHLTTTAISRRNERTVTYNEDTGKREAQVKKTTTKTTTMRKVAADDDDNDDEVCIDDLESQRPNKRRSSLAIRSQRARNNNKNNNNDSSSDDDSDVQLKKTSKMSSRSRKDDDEIEKPKQRAARRMTVGLDQIARAESPERSSSARRSTIIGTASPARSKTRVSSTTRKNRA